MDSLISCMLGFSHDVSISGILDSSIENLSFIGPFKLQEISSDMKLQQSYMNI